MIPEVSPELPLSRDVGEKIQGEIGIGFRLNGFDVRKSSIDRTQQMAPDLLTLRVRVEPLPILPEMASFRW